MTSSFADRFINSRSAFRPPSLNVDVATLRPSELAGFFPKCRDPGLRFRVALVEAHQDTDPPQLVWLLRARRERPDGRRAEERYELASPHCLPQALTSADPGL
jgi:hypothetical protein